MEEFVKVEGDIISHVGFDELTDSLENGEKTLLDILKKKVEIDGDRKMFGTIVGDAIVYESYKSIDMQALKLAMFLEKITEEKEIIGIASVNRKEWLVAEYATYYSDCINSPVYTTFPPATLAYAIEKAKMNTIIASSAAAKCLIGTVLSLCKTHKFKRIILMDDDNEIVTKCTEQNIEVRMLSDIYREYDISNPMPKRTPPSKNDLATVCFTSGTGGNPKGVELTHSNFIAQLSGFIIGYKKYEIINVNDNDCYFSYLPLAHVLERICVCICIYMGARIGFWRGNRDLISEDYKIIKPTFIPAVPKVLQVFHDKIEKKVMETSFLKRMMFRLGMKYKIFMQRFGIYSSWFWDCLIFGDISKQFGGNIRGCLCGGAAVNENLVKYMQCILSARIFQGYGQTEGLGANALCTFSSTDTSSIGIPFITTQMKLVSIEGYPETHKMLYIRGPSITRGYFDDPKATKKAFKDGWLETGDIVEFRNKKLYVVGRFKDMIKLGNGEYISPEFIEGELNDRNIYGVDDLYIAMKIGMMNPVLLIVCKDKNANHDNIIKDIVSITKDLCKEGKINGFVSFQNFVFLDKDFSSYQTENDSLITSTMKKKRKAIDNYFSDLIEKAYQKKYKNY